MNLPNSHIKKIAESLDCGLVCYIHKKTKEITEILDPDNPYTDLELIEEELKEVEENWDKYTEVKKMSSSESFQIMEDFVDLVDSKAISERLIYALNNRKPFRNFKHIVDHSGDVRQQWFKFKAARSEEWVREFFADIPEEETNPADESNENEPIIFNGYFDDDGNKVNPNLTPLPGLCMSCKKRNDPNEEILCNLNRMDQAGAEEFVCGAYEQLGK